MFCLGDTDLVDGRGSFKIDDPQAILAASQAVLERGLLVDFDHATERKETGASAPAAGWIHKLEAREDGIWGLVR